jgi:lipid A ethanolaminephosphotransferase
MFSTCNRKTLLVSVFLMATANISLFQRLLEVYPPSASNVLLLISLGFFFTFATALFLLLVAHTRSARWLLALLVLVASQAAYYMDTYGVVVDTVMIDNIFHTDTQEFAGLLSWGLVLRTLLLGVLPAWLIIRYWPAGKGFKAEFKSKLSLTLLLIIGMVLVVAPFTAHYASFIREHKITRAYANPIYPVYSLFGYAHEKLKSTAITALTATAPDAVMIGTPSQHELIILVVGETARADRFSLNGYPRDTNPELAKRDVLSLRNVSSCGTSTGESVPCMFCLSMACRFCGATTIPTPKASPRA